MKHKALEEYKTHNYSLPSLEIEDDGGENF